MIKYLLLFTLLLPIKFFSQIIIANPFNATNENLKSPQIHLLKQFADYPVDLSRGLVDVSIPIHDIKFADKNIPVKLMFHPSGLKANVTENGMLGLKWALNAGGFISREVRGYPDEVRDHKQGIVGLSYIPNWLTLYGGESDRGFANNNPYFQNSDLEYFGMPEVYGKYEDTEYDIFTFTLPNGQSGKFILKDNNGKKLASFMPFKPYKLNSSVEYLPNRSYSQFEITDDEGYVYSFGKSDSGTSYCETDFEGKYINSWMLTSIISPNKKDIIKFDYISTTVNGNSPLTPVIINDQLNSNYYFYPAGEPCNEATNNSALWDALESTLYDSAGYLQMHYNEPAYNYDNVFYLSNITYYDEKVNFTYDTNAADYNGVLLKKIEVFKDNTIIKKVGFDVTNAAVPESSTIGGVNTNYLKTVSFMGATEEVIEKYSFEYFDLHKFPEMNKLSNNADYWGYYNSEVENVILKDTVDIYWMPFCGNQQVLKREIGSGDSRYSNTEDMKIGMIKSITYPTGGKTVFDYEANQYKEGNIIRECGGLRIKSIIDKDKNGNGLKKRAFTYGKNENGAGEIPVYLIPDINVRNSFEEVETSYCIDDDVQHENDFDLGNYKTRYFTGYFPGKYYTFLYNLVSYDKVTEYLGDSNHNNGKIENYYATNIPLYYDYVFDYNKFRYQQNKYSIDPSNFWQGNHLSQKMEYKKANGIYSKVKQTDYSYEEKIVDEIYDLSIFRYKNFVGYRTSGLSPVRTAINELNQVISNPMDFFGYKMQKYTIGVENLKETTEKLYLANDSIVQTATNIYDINKPTFLKESKIINSKGKNISQKYLYPFEINTGVYSEMTTANVISPVVEKVSLNDTNVTGSTLLTYKKSDANFVPDKNYVTELMNPIPYSGFSVFNGTTKDTHYSSNSEISYDSFDVDGNLTQVTSKGGIVTCFIWGYDEKYPVAKIENMTYANISPSLISAIEIASSSTGTEANLLTALNNLRNNLALSNAMVTTYTYKPLVGITSMTDSKGDVTYYEYDSYGRLEKVKDKENNILSKNQYHYKNQ